MDNFMETFRRAFPVPPPAAAFSAPIQRLRLNSALAFIARTLWFAILLCVFSAGVLWASDRAPPVILLESSHAASAPAGGDLASTLRVFRTRVCPTRLERAVTDSKGTRFDLPDVDWQAFGGEGEDVYTQLIPIDPRAAPGPARFDAVLTYRCNPAQYVWPIIVRRPSRHFEITRGAGHGP